MRESVILPSDPARGDGEITWHATMRIPDGEPLRVAHRFTCDDSSRPTCTARTFLLTFLPVAMRLGHPVAVDGPVDQTAIEHLMEWQEAMARWHPGQLRVVPIRSDAPDATTLPGASTEPRRAISAFSGGVDSSFTAVRNRPRAEAGPTPLHRRTTVATGLMVQGFDIGLDDHTTFAAAFGRSTQILAGLGIGAHQLATDVRHVLEQPYSIDWETVGHGIWLAAALSCFEGDHDLAIVPSTFPYDHQVLPWASNPLTDPLLSGADLPLWHDGAAFDKLDKVRHLVGFESVEAGLRVCWEGGRLDRNCGHCYKCIVTQACFWVSGVDRPPCFEHPASAGELAALHFRRDRYRTALAERIGRGAIDVGRHDVAAAIDEALGR